MATQVKVSTIQQMANAIEKVGGTKEADKFVKKVLKKK